jgi:uncharacterized membrane protein YeaQ/YmgE (transglycosylase-associated protein family)
MTSLTDPAIVFIIVLLIGIVAGCLAQWATRTSWLSKQIIGTGRVYATSALVGIAGSFIGFHIASLLKLSASGSVVAFIGAAVGAVVILWGWRMIRR